MATSAHHVRSIQRAAVAAARGNSLAHPRFEAYLEALDGLADLPGDDVGERVAREVQKLVECCDWLPEECCEPGDDSYRRHLLHADPAGRFTVLAVVWRPGQATPVHGHTAWGAVGVYRGHPTVDCFDYQEGGEPELKGQYECCPGQVSHVDAGVCSPHRIANLSDGLAITIHTYGRDLTENPAAINIVLDS